MAGVMLATLLLLLCVGAATIGGVFFAFSVFVLRALSDLPAESGIAAMQRINIVVLNRVFLGVFIGTAILSLALAVVAVATWSLPRSALLLAAAGLYFLGSYMVTITFQCAPQQPFSAPFGSLTRGSFLLACLCPRVGYVESCAHGCLARLLCLRRLGHGLLVVRA